MCCLLSVGSGGAAGPRGVCTSVLLAPYTPRSRLGDVPSTMGICTQCLHVHTGGAQILPWGCGVYVWR